ncbi:hypothetical protein NNO_0381 [Hydrogenimonas sp.]|nr:hypothetical protein NNO_0381 [Hydrogenimonas sp.]
MSESCLHCLLLIEFASTYFHYRRRFFNNKLNISKCIKSISDTNIYLIYKKFWSGRRGRDSFPFGGLYPYIYARKRYCWQLLVRTQCFALQFRIRKEF